LIFSNWSQKLKNSPFIFQLFFQLHYYAEKKKKQINPK
jgi:hypothetical protein